MSKELPPDKREVARSLLLRGSMFVHLDPRVEGVVVPPWLRKQPQLVLQMGLDMVVPIVDLRIDKDGVYGTLSFNRSPFTCIVGWDAIFALAGDDGRGMVWPESMPPEILAEVEREAGRQGPVPLSAVADLRDDYDEDDEYDDDDDEYDDDRPQASGKGRPGNVIRLAPKLSALQGGLSQQAKRTPSAAPGAPAAGPSSPPAQRPSSVPSPVSAAQDEGVRERDTLELVEPGDGASADTIAKDAPSAGQAPSDAARPDASAASGEGAADDAARPAKLPSVPPRKSPAESVRPQAKAPQPSQRPSRATNAARSTRGDDDEPETPPPAPRGSHLRLIK